MKPVLSQELQDFSSEKKLVDTVTQIDQVNLDTVDRIGDLINEVISDGKKIKKVKKLLKNSLEERQVGLSHPAPNSLVSSSGQMSFFSKSSL